jgi:hypothetical protein
MDLVTSKKDLLLKPQFRSNRYHWGARQLQHYVLNIPQVCPLVGSYEIEVSLLCGSRQFWNNLSRGCSLNFSKWFEKRIDALTTFRVALHQEEDLFQHKILHRLSSTSDARFVK